MKYSAKVTSVIIAAAGEGSRWNSDISKLNNWQLLMGNQ